MAALAGHVESITILTSAHVSVNATDNKGRTAIFLAAAEDNVSAIEKLHELGADLSARDHRGCTSVFIAANRGHVTVVEKLIELGADPLCLNDKGETPLSYVKRRHSRVSSGLEAALSRKAKRESSTGFWKTRLFGRKHN